MLIEALVRAPRSMAAAPDYKFFVFGGQVAAVFYVQGRHTREECSAWYVPRTMPPAERLLSHYNYIMLVLATIPISMLVLATIPIGTTPSGLGGSMRTAACARGLRTARLRASFCSPSTSEAARPHRGMQAIGYAT